MEEAKLRHLKSVSLAIRQDIVRMVSEAGSGHPGGSLSIADIVTVLFFDVMKHDPADHCWDGARSFHPFKGARLPGGLRRACRKRLLPEGRTANVEEAWVPSPGPPGYV